MNATLALDELIDRLADKLNRIYAQDCTWKERAHWPKNHNGTILPPPATEAQISGLERKIGRTLPTSYRQFLRRHNGWEHFWGDFTLIGATGHHTERVFAEVEEYVETQREEDVADFTEEQIAEWEAANVRNLFLANHITFGSNFGGELWVFDTRTRRPDGEMAVAYWTLEYGVWQENRHEDFITFLRWASAMADDALGRLAAQSQPRRKTAGRTTGARKSSSGKQQSSTALKKSAVRQLTRKRRSK